MWGIHTSCPHELTDAFNKILDVSGGMEGVPPSGNFTAGGDQELNPPTPHQFTISLTYEMKMFVAVQTYE